MTVADPYTRPLAGSAALVLIDVPANAGGRSCMSCGCTGPTART